MSHLKNRSDGAQAYTRTNWTDPEVQQRLRQAHKYDLLVPDHVPMKHLKNLLNG